MTQSRLTAGLFAVTVTAGPTPNYSAIAKNGSKEAALEAARNYRQQLLEKLSKIPPKKRARRVVSKDSRNRTGELGVSRTSKKGPKGAIYESRLMLAPRTWSAKKYLFFYQKVR